MTALPSANTAAQKSAVAHETASSPSFGCPLSARFGSIERNADQAEPFHSASLPSDPTAAQKLAVGHDTEPTLGVQT